MYCSTTRLVITVSMWMAAPLILFLVLFPFSCFHPLILFLALVPSPSMGYCFTPGWNPRLSGPPIVHQVFSPPTQSCLLPLIGQRLPPSPPPTKGFSNFSERVLARSSSLLRMRRQHSSEALPQLPQWASVRGSNFFSSKDVILQSIDKVSDLR